MKKTFIVLLFTAAIVSISCNNDETSDDGQPEQALDWKIDEKGDSFVIVKGFTVKKIKAQTVEDMVEYYRTSNEVILRDPTDPTEDVRSTLFSEFSLEFIRALVNQIMTTGEKFMVVTAAYTEDGEFNGVSYRRNEPTIVIRTYSPATGPNYYLPAKQELCPEPTPCP